MLGVIGFCVSGCWLAHIIIYMLPPVPIHPLLNDVFIKLDGVFPLFGVAAFAAFCAYLMGEYGLIAFSSGSARLACIMA
jgi:LMBR1 domain-containing protein 1